MSVDQAIFSSADNLEVMKAAHRYNGYLAGLVLRWRGMARAALDFGAMTVLIRRRGLQVQCVEQDPALARTLSELGFTVVPDIATVPAQSAQYIYSLNVLEHIEDDRATLAGALRPGGRLLLYAPAFSLLFSSLDRKVGHHRRYRRRQLVALCRAQGLRINTKRYVDSLGFFATLLFRAFGNRQGSISPLGLKLFDTFAFPCSRLLDTVCSPFFGKNLLVVATRPIHSRGAAPPAAADER